MNAQRDLFAGRAARDEGFKRVHRPTFSERVHAAVLELVGREVVGEDIRRYCTANGIVPHHPNAWGGVTSGLRKNGTLVFTGRYKQMEDPRSHARETKIYLVTEPRKEAT
jgi:hypothetical protein